MNSISAWVRAARPKTLPAAVVPVAIGGSLAGASGFFDAAPWTICLVFALLVQIGTNFANDYYDFIKGADDARRIGPSRAVASGWIAPQAMRRATWITFACAFCFGCLLIPYGGWVLLLVGTLSILCGVAYTGGPYPLGYNGWGDVFVFLFFGWVATGFTYYVQAGTFVVHLPGAGGGVWTLLAGIIPGALATNLLVVNNVRDEPLDREAGKHTLAVRHGRSAGHAQFTLLNLLVLLVALEFALLAGTTGTLLVFLALPLMWRTRSQFGQADSREAYDRVLGLTAAILLGVGFLFPVGILISG